MGQINTNNYPAVDSLLDADLLIVENATHGTGTTTPKQLRENAIGTDPLQTTAQTVTGAINEIFEMATDTVVGLELGKMTSFSDGVIVTDIDLHREPVAGDRILFYHSTAVASPSSLTTYNDGVAVTTTIGDFSLTHPAGLTLMKCVALGESLRWQTVQDIADGGYTAGAGISINGTTINNSAPQLGDDIAYSRIDTVTCGALGYFSADADCLVMDFRTDAEPYNGGYTLRLTTTGASFKYAVLKDKAGNNYAEEIPSGSLVMCKSNVSGTGSEADPVIVTVLEIGNTTMANDVEILKDVIITEKTVSGNPITLTDALPYPAVSLSADIEPIQDLHGYDKPWVGGAYKNKLANDNAQNTTTNGIVVTVDSQGVIDLHGTASASTFIYTQGTGWGSGTPPTTLVDGQTYTWGYGKTDTEMGGLRYSVYGLKNNNVVFSAGGNAEPPFTHNFTYSSDIDSFFCYIRIPEGTELNHFKLYPQIEQGTSETAFAPYSNICPISGHSSVTITRTDAESQTADFTIQLGQTVYGADINWVTGVMTVNKASGDTTITKIYQRSGNANCDFAVFVLPDGILYHGNMTDMQCDKGYFNSAVNFDSATLGCILAFDSGRREYAIAMPKGYTLEQAQSYYGTIQICDVLAEPATVQLTPTQLQMLKGYNNISSDGGGDITLTYKADRLAAIEAALAQITAQLAET